jgi:IS1 family transposase
MIDVLKARLKVSEIQTDIYKLYEEQIGRQLRELIYKRVER